MCEAERVVSRKRLKKVDVFVGVEPVAKPTGTAHAEVSTPLRLRSSLDLTSMNAVKYDRVKMVNVLWIKRGRSEA